MGDKHSDLINKSRAAFLKWRALPAPERGNYIRLFGEALREQKKEVANKDLWLQLYDLNNTYNINWNWVKAHETNTYNNLADEYAVLSMKNQKSYKIENYTTTNV